MTELWLVSILAWNVDEIAAQDTRLAPQGYIDRSWLPTSVKFLE